MGFNLNSQSARRLYHDIWRDPHLVGFWPLNEGSSAVYDHALAYRNNATGVGTTPGDSVGELPAMTFTQSASNYVVMASSPINVGRTSPFTAIVAAEHNAANTAQTYLSKVATKGFIWQQDVSGKPYVLLFETLVTDNIIKESDVVNVSATPYLLGLTYDGGGAATGMTFWRNGSTESSSTVADNLTGAATTTGALSVGQNLSTGYMDGAIGFVALFNAVKTPLDMKRWARLGGFA